jgi:hypothetical protein
VRNTEPINISILTDINNLEIADIDIQSANADKKSKSRKKAKTSDVARELLALTKTEKEETKKCAVPIRIQRLANGGCRHFLVRPYACPIVSRTVLVPQDHEIKL